MKGKFRQPWQDDAGIVALEYLLVATIVGLGLAIGLSAIFTAMSSELSEQSNATMALNQDFGVIGTQGFPRNASTGSGLVNGFRADTLATGDRFQKNTIRGFFGRGHDINVAP
jgi:Flp pilus assembly pilin Flp